MTRQNRKNRFFADNTLRKIDLLLLGAIIIFALSVRVFHAKSGLPYMHHWDEPEIAFNALTMMINKDLNPQAFNYGSLMKYLNLGVYSLHTVYLKNLPETSPLHLTSLADIQYEETTGFGWFISHSSYLFWGRVLTATLGALTVGVVYYLALRLGNRFAAIAAALLLAATLTHIQHSSYVTADVPMTLFVWVVILFSYLYLDRGKLTHWIVALVFCGFVTSIKYNAGLVVLVPSLALLFSRRQAHYRWWLLIPVIPSLAFFVTSPYALLDFATFFEDVSYELLHYSVYGHSDATIEPGIPHIIYQVRLFKANFGLMVLILGLIGLAKLLGKTARPFGWLLVGYQILYFLLVTQTRVSFHRNFLLLYPFVALLFGLGILTVLQLISGVEQIDAKLSDNLERVLRIGTKLVHMAVTLLVLGYLLVISSQAWQQGWEIFTTPESRTQAITAVNDLLATSEYPFVGIAAELRIHPDDLARLNARYNEEAYLDLLDEADVYDYLLGFNEVFGTNQSQRNQAKQINAVIKNIPTELQTVIGSGELWLDTFSVNPGVVIISQPEGIQNLISP